MAKRTFQENYQEFRSTSREVLCHPISFLVNTALDPTFLSFLGMSRFTDTNILVQDILLAGQVGCLLTRAYVEAQKFRPKAIVSAMIEMGGDQDATTHSATYEYGQPGKTVYRPKALSRRVLRDINDRFYSALRDRPQLLVQAAVQSAAALTITITDGSDLNTPEKIAALSCAIVGNVLFAMIDGGPRDSSLPDKQNPFTYFGKFGLRLVLSSLSWWAAQFFITGGTGGNGPLDVVADVAYLAAVLHTILKSWPDTARYFTKDIEQHDFKQRSDLAGLSKSDIDKALSLFLSNTSIAGKNLLAVVRQKDFGLFLFAIGCGAALVKNTGLSLHGVPDDLRRAEAMLCYTASCLGLYTMNLSGGIAEFGKSLKRPALVKTPAVMSGPKL